MRIYNTMSRSLEELKPLKAGKIGMYSCGPTVYWNQHIGHMYAYVQWDSLVRVLRSNGLEVTWVMNITDVGHLTSDEDAGEDKMEKGARRENITVWEIAEKYIAQFVDSLDKLNIQRPNVLCRATEHIQEQVDLIKKIEANGFTYKTGTGLVFDTGKFPRYAEFANLDLSKQDAGARVEVDPEKKKPWDFLLWVTNQPNHIMLWDSPWGKGFPGWHIECTAMSTKYLGEQFDIHTGGKEHIAIHHTNEIAQGYGAFRHETAKYWMHNEWLLIDGEKMSKSLGNNVLVTDLIDKGFNPMALRYLILTSHYRRGLNFTWSSMAAAQAAYDKLMGFIKEVQSRGEGQRKDLSKEKARKLEEYRIRFMNAVNDDLGMPQALAVVWEMMKSNIPDYDKADQILDWDQILGLRLSEAQSEVKVPEEVRSLVAEREKLRQNGKFVDADKLRMVIEEKGFMVQDSTTGAQIKPKSTKVV
jgi:cysteinyl-tRNA synthetase